MAVDRFYIGYVDQNSGLQTNVRPYAIPDSAFARLNNAYVFRGRVRKRFGAELLEGSVPTPGYEQLQSRLRINIGNTPGPLNIPGAFPQLAIGQMFSVGDNIFTIWQLGAGVTTFSTNPAITATIDSVVNPNTVTFVGAPPATTVYWYPALPVMGLSTLEQSNINDESLVAFDTQFAYQYTTTGFERIAGEAAPGDSVWTGSNSQFFWTTNYRGATASDNFLFVTNFNENEPNFMRYLSAGGTTWNSFRPQITVTPTYLNSARILVAFKNRLIALNTWEGAVSPGSNFRQRARYSQIGDPTDLVNGWREDVPGRGNFIDAATSESIVTAEFIKDRLIVYFERSTWELVYTGNQAYPFLWQQINTELGAESTFSIIPFDKVAIGVGNVGIHACNGSNVERIDSSIPDAVFEFHNENDGVERVYGIRDYYVEMIYWSIPDVTRDATFPFNNRILVYNYQTGTWAFNEDSITCFGYFQQQQSGTAIIWANLNQTWAETELTWGSAPLQGRFRNVVAGNQEGFVFLVNADAGRNAPSLQITDILTTPTTQLTIVNHNLSDGSMGPADFIIIENAQGVTGLNGNIYKIQQVIDANTIDLGNVPFTGTYTGGGTAARVSVIDIYTKQYNFYANRGRNAYVSKVDFMVDKTSDGAITIDYFISSSEFSLVTGGTATGALVGTSVLETFPYALIPFEQQQARLWHPVYVQADGEYVQLRVYLSDDQVTDPDIAFSDFELHAMIFYATPTSARLQ